MLCYAAKAKWFSHPLSTCSLANHLSPQKASPLETQVQILPTLLLNTCVWGFPHDFYHYFLTTTEGTNKEDLYILDTCPVPHLAWIIFIKSLQNFLEDCDSCFANETFAWDFTALTRTDVNFSHQVLSLVSCTSYSELSKKQNEDSWHVSAAIKLGEERVSERNFPRTLLFEPFFQQPWARWSSAEEQPVRVERQERITPRWLKARLSCPLPLPGLQLGRFVSMWTRVFFQMYHRKWTHSDEW